MRRGAEGRKRDQGTGENSCALSWRQKPVAQSVRRAMAWKRPGAGRGKGRNWLQGHLLNQLSLSVSVAVKCMGYRMDHTWSLPTEVSRLLRTVMYL